MSLLRRVLAGGLLAGWLAIPGPSPVLAQGPTIGGDSPGAPGGSSSSMGPIPGAGASNYQNPGGGGQVLGGRPGAGVPRVPTSISTPANAQQPGISPSISAPTNLAPANLPIFGSLAIPKVAEDEGPADGMTLDQAIDKYVHDSLELKGKYLEIPQAKADTLAASLRANPIFYADAQLVPYGQYSNARPGGQTQYDVNISYPLDLTQKRKARTLVATRAERVLEAQYQDAVRQGIDNIYSAYVDVLAARGAVRFSEAGVEGLRNLYNATYALFKQGEKPKTDVNRIKIQLDNAEIGMLSNKEAYRRAKRALGVLLNMTPRESEELEFRGSLKDVYPQPPPSEELEKMALTVRPDILSFRLGVSRADADVRLAKANVLPDVYVLYQPYTLQDNTYQGLKSPTSWALGVTIPIPIYNQNQGAIKRARLNVTQSQIQLAQLEKQSISDVRQAEQAYIVSLANVKRYEESTLPDAETVLSDSKRLFESGEINVIDYLNARRDYNDIARAYLDTLVAHRRSMLDLNTAVGQRILP